MSRRFSHQPEGMTYFRPSLNDHFRGKGPKRILALDGGGVRGMLSLGFLAEVEGLLRRPAMATAPTFDSVTTLI